jgi:hypothetical protein
VRCENALAYYNATGSLVRLENNKICSFTLRNALAYYNSGNVVVVNYEVVGSTPAFEAVRAKLKSTRPRGEAASKPESRVTRLGEFFVHWANVYFVVQFSR